MTTGSAFKLRLEVAHLMRRHRFSPAPFAPPKPRPPVDGEIIVTGLASPANIDRERAKFGPHCWMPFKKDIPLLYKHDPNRIAGKVIEVCSTDEGLYVRCLVTDPAAKQCSFFSVAATVHDYLLRQIDDPHQFHGLISCATLDEVTITNTPANPDAVIAYGSQPSPLLQGIDLGIEGIRKCQQIVELLQKLSARDEGGVPSSRTPLLASVHKTTPPHVRKGPIKRNIPPREPHRQTPFGQLITALEARSSP